MTNRAAATRISQIDPNTKYRLDTSYRRRNRRNSGKTLPAHMNGMINPIPTRTTTYPTMPTEGGE